jgi:hypothetical protein
VLESYADDATFDELKEAIDDMNVDEQCELVALTWVGRGDFSKDEWEEALQAAREAHNDHTAAYLLGTPLLPDYLEEGLAAFDLSCQDFEYHFPGARLVLWGNSFLTVSMRKGTLT